VGCRTLAERCPAFGGGHCSHRATTTVPRSAPNAARTPNPTPSSAGVASSGHAGDHAAADRLQSAAGVGLSAALGSHHPQFARGYTPVSKATSRIILVDNSITPPLFYWAFQGRILSPLIFDDRVTCGDCTTRYWHESIGGRSTGQIDATQTELGSELDVCAATISNRLNSIDGFDWQDRRAFARGVFGDGQSASGPSSDPEPEPGSGSASAGESGSGGGPASAGEEPSRPAPTPEATFASRSEFRGPPEARDSSGTEIPAPSQLPAHQSSGEPSDETTPGEFGRRVAALEDRLDSDGTVSSPAFEDPKLLHKVVHACLRAETISEEEELLILQAVLR